MRNLSALFILFFGLFIVGKAEAEKKPEISVSSNDDGSTVHIKILDNRENIFDLSKKGEVARWRILYKSAHKRIGMSVWFQNGKCDMVTATIETNRKLDYGETIFTHDTWKYENVGVFFKKIDRRVQEYKKRFNFLKLAQKESRRKKKWNEKKVAKRKKEDAKHKERFIRKLIDSSDKLLK